MLDGHHCVAYRIIIEFILSLSKGLDSEFVIGERFVEIKNESVNGVRRRGVPKKRIYFQLIVFKDSMFFYFFLLTKRI
jgi:hypothetical protein